MIIQKTHQFFKREKTKDIRLDDINEGGLKRKDMKAVTTGRHKDISNLESYQILNRCQMSFSVSSAN